MPYKILIIHTQENLKPIFERILKDYEIIFSPEPERVNELIDKFSPDIIFIDMRFPHKKGIEILADIVIKNPYIPVVGLTLYPNIPEAVEFIKNGGFDYLTVPFEAHTLKKIISDALESNIKQPTFLTTQLTKKFDLIVGNSDPIKILKNKILKIAKTDATILIYGETGVGKELTAKTIHENSHRAKGPFIVIDCTSLPSSLIESELFGAEKGAYTGAQTARKGLIEAANGGTLFLDEISELEHTSQAKLLRFLEEKSIRRVGGIKNIKVDTRVIAATNKDLKKLVKEGKFRADLYYRLKTISIYIPTLKERVEDIPLLATHFFAYYQKYYNRHDLKGLTDEAINFLINQDWKGNIRELRNCIEQAVILSKGPYIHVDDFKELLSESDLEEYESIPENFSEYLHKRNEIIKQFDKKFFSLLLSKYRGNISEIARQTGISRKTIYQKLKDIGLI